MDMSKLYCLTDSQNKLYLNAIIDTFSKATNNTANNLFSIMILFNQNIKPVKKQNKSSNHYHKITKKNVY